MKKIRFAAIVLLLPVLAATCCKQDMVYYIKTDPQALHFDKDGGIDTVAVTSNSGWTVAIPEDWCKTNLSSVEFIKKPVFLSFTVAKNTTTLARSQDVVISSKSDNKVQSVIRITQDAGDDPDDPGEEDPDEEDPQHIDTADTLQVLPAAVEISCKGGTYEFSLVADTTWAYQGSSEPWCELIEERTEGGRGQYQLTFIADTSKRSQIRTATLTFKTVNDTLALLTVNQRPLGISVPDDLMEFRDDVNALRDLRPWMDNDSTIHLLSDLDMSSAGNWKPIGLHTNISNYSMDNSSMSGTFNGNGHKISNLTITKTSLRSAGLFGYVRMAEIKDLVLDETCSMTLTSGQYQTLHAGGICGTLVAGTITNCHFNGVIEITGNSTTTLTGGIVGMTDIFPWDNLSVVSACTNSGKVQGLFFTGGIAGKHYGSIITGCENTVNARVIGSGSVGGICGASITKSNINNSRNYGYVEGSNEKTGGICGEQYNTSVMSNCVNYTGSVIKGTSRVGGICGYQTTSCHIKNCVNESDISGISEVGGICGAQFISCSINGCSNSGTVMATGVSIEDNKGIGGIAGGNLNSEVIDSNNTGRVTGAGSVGGIVGYGNYVIKGCSNSAAIEGIRFVGGISGMLEGSGFVVSFLNNSGTVTASAGVGGIIGSVTSSASISFCNNMEGADIVASAGSAGGIAGIVGTELNTGSILSDCENRASVSSGKRAGGIVGVGYGRIKKCLNLGAVSVPMTNDPIEETEGVRVDNIAFAGGIAGLNSFSVENCENRGSVAGYTAGGIVSHYTSKVSTYKITDCTNSGQITGTKSAAGIVATITQGGLVEGVENVGNVTGSYNVAGIVAENLRGSLTDCVNTGQIQGSDAELDDNFFALGGICALNSGGNLTNCTNSGTINRVGETGKYRYVGGVVGVTAQTAGIGGVLEDCSNSGPVSGYVSENIEDHCYVGGFCGFFISGPVPENCTNTGTVNGQPASDENMYGGTN